MTRARFAVAERQRTLRVMRANLLAVARNIRDVRHWSPADYLALRARPPAMHRRMDSHAPRNAR